MCVCVCVCVFVPVAQVYEELETGGVFEDGSIKRSHLFLSVHDAILCAQQRLTTLSASEKASQPLKSFTILQGSHLVSNQLSVTGAALAHLAL